MSENSKKQNPKVEDLSQYGKPLTRLPKGDDFCDFMFYRKGTAPDTEHLNK